MYEGINKANEEGEGGRNAFIKSHFLKKKNLYLNSNRNQI